MGTDISISRVKYRLTIRQPEEGYSSLKNEATMEFDSIDTISYLINQAEVPDGTEFVIKKVVNVE